MSYNRGNYRQDSRQPYRSNMGQRGSLNVSPWECGVAPNASLSRTGLQSLLPSPPQLQTNNNILSQQQHALVMASNLLSNLGLLPQQQGQQHGSQDLPSLMNMRTLGNSQSFRLPPQQHYGSQGPNRYNNLQPMRRYKPLESHRVEPYKNRARQTAQQPKRPPYKPAANKAAANAVSGKNKKAVKPAVTAASAGDGVKVDAKSVELPLETATGDQDEEAKREEDGEAAKKRDWKAEKPGDEVSEETMDVDKASKEEEVEEADEVVEEGAEVAGEGKFFCHVCNKYPKDEQSLKVHLTQRSHKTKMTRLDASYKAKAEEMRVSMQKVVQKQEAEIRHGRKPPVAGRDYCKMCDLNFFGTIVNHRKNEMHLQLKTFLHPRCGTCAREFPTRMEWDLHKLTVSHQQRERKREDSRQSNASGVPSTKVESSDATTPVADKPRARASLAADATYDPEAAVGTEYLATGQHCKLCERFFERRYDAKAHCMSEQHFNLCLAKAKAAAEESARLKKEEADKAELAAKQKEAEKPAELMEADEVAADESIPVMDESDNEGNWKRRKVDVVKSEETPEPTPSDEVYDPLEATDDDNSEMMKEDEDVTSVLNALDQEIGEVLESAALDAANGIKEEEEDEVVDVTPKISPGMKARRGRGATATRGRKRK